MAEVWSAATRRRFLPPQTQVQSGDKSPHSISLSRFAGVVIFDGWGSWGDALRAPPQANLHPSRDAQLGTLLFHAFSVKTHPLTQVVLKRA